VFLVSELNRDKIYLALQSKNLLAGHGLSISKYFSSSLDAPVYDFTPMWPPGYAITLAPLLKIFNNNVYWATTTLDLAACIAIIFIVRGIAKRLGFPITAVNIATLIAGCFDYAFIDQSLPTDASSFAIFLFGLYLLIGVVQKKSFDLTGILLVSLLLFIPCTFRYSYPPLSIAALFALILIGWHVKNQMLIKKGFIGLAFLGILLSTFFILLKTTTGKAGYIVETEKGFFPANLLDWAPVGPGAFINTFFTTSQMIRVSNISVDKAMNLLEIISAIMLSALVVFIFYLFFKKKFFKPVDPFRWFLLSGFLIFAATCVSLGYLSLTYKPQPGWGNYLGEPRYFTFVTFYIQLIFLGGVFLYQSWKKSIFQKTIVYLLLFLFFVEIAHSVYYHTKAVFNFDTYRAATYKEADYVYFSKMMQPVIKDNPEADIIVIAESDEFYPLMGSFLGLKGLYDGQQFIKSLPAIKKKTIVIFTLYDNETEKYEQFIADHKGVLINKVNSVAFYRVDLVPL